MSEVPPPLPDVFMTVLERDQAARIFDDVARHAELLQVTLKGGARDLAAEPGCDLATARRFLDGDERGLQLRYRFGDAVWTDTFMRLPSGRLRLVRVAS